MPAATVCAAPLYSTVPEFIARPLAAPENLIVAPILSIVVAISVLLPMSRTAATLDAPPLSSVVTVIAPPAVFVPTAVVFNVA